MSPNRAALAKIVKRYQVLFFIGPAVLYVLAFTAYPALYSVFISLTNINLGMSGWRFVGLDNYQRLFDWEFLPVVLRNTAFLVIGASVLQISIGFGIALLLNQNWPFRRVVRGIAVLPWVIPSIVIGLLFQQIFNGSRIGIANVMISGIGLEPRSWLTEPMQAMTIMLGSLVWRGIPLSTIILLGGLQTIPRDVYEASAIDGASKFQQFIYVTLPLMRPILLINLIWVTAGNLNHLDIPVALTGGAPSHQTEVLSVTLYDQAFRMLDGGLAAAIATLMLIVNLGATIVYLAVLRARS